jgi:hypothetical protein
MSSADPAHAAAAHDAHAFTGEPVRELPADETPTPNWLPLLGLALFTSAAVVFLAGRADRGAKPEDGAQANQAAVTVAPPAPSPQPARVVPAAQPPPQLAPRPQPAQPTQAAQPAQPAAVAPALPSKLTPEQAAEIRKKIQQRAFPTTH